jgi:GTP-binding protein
MKAKMIKIRSSNFISGHPTLDSIPLSDFPEVMLVGRSNAGKSTLVNRITERKRLATTGRTPGTTQQINIFDVDLEDGDCERYIIRVVDFPGYGYSRFSKAKRSSVSKEVVRFITERSSLRVVCLLNDAYRDPELDELSIKRISESEHRCFLAVITKMDRLNQKEKHERLLKLEAEFDLERSEFLLTGKNDSGAVFWRKILALLSQSALGRVEQAPI